MQTLFRDRFHGGQVLATHLMQYEGQRNLVVLALPRGGVPVASEIAKVLKAPLDIFLVRKLGLPGQEEFAMGAIASGGVRVLNPQIQNFQIPKETIEKVAREELVELKRRETLYRGGKPPVAVEGLTVILVDDGLATGSSMHAAVAALRQKNPARIIVAVPVSAQETCVSFQNEVDEIICALTPDPFYAVGLWYEHFPQMADEEVCELLCQAGENYQRSQGHQEAA
jgi:putative phosphoribosyl transferase